MQNFKERLYNFESDPPESIWDNIVTELDENKIIKMPLRRRSRFVFYAVTAAASLVIIFISSLFFNKNNADLTKKTAAFSSVNSDTAKKKDNKASLNNQTLESIIQSSKDKSQAIKINKLPGKYITIAGPGGQPVKISSKVATLIVSADNDYPPKAVWDKKINKWKQIMLSSTLSPTASNLLDIVELSSARGDN